MSYFPLQNTLKVKLNSQDKQTGRCLGNQRWLVGTTPEPYLRLFNRVLNETQLNYTKFNAPLGKGQFPDKLACTIHFDLTFFTTRDNEIIWYNVLKLSTSSVRKE